MKIIVIDDQRINTMHIHSWQGIANHHMQYEEVVMVSLEIVYGDSIYTKSFGFKQVEPASYMVREIDKFMRNDNTWLDLGKVYSQLQNTDDQVNPNNNVA